MRKFVSRLTTALVAVTLVTAAADAQTFNGTTVGGPTWNRPLGGTPPTALSGVGTNVAYDVLHFRVTLTGTYNFLNTAIAPTNWDNYLFLYAGAFEPTTPFVNVVIGNDDFGSIGVSGFNGVALTAGQEYYAVTSGFSNTSEGSYELSISGQGTAFVPRPVSSVPEPTSVALVLLGLGAMGASTRRRRSV